MSMVQRAKLFPSCRMSLALMVMTGTFILFHLRINLNFAIVCMVKERPLNSTATNTSKAICRQLNNTNDGGADLELFNDSLKLMYNILYFKDGIIMGEFEWDKELQALVLGSVYWGFCSSQIVGGFLGDRGSSKKIILFGMGIYSILSFFIPLAARWNVGILITLRVIQGFCSGLSSPCFNVLFRHWTTKEERATLAGIGYSGYTIASVLTFPISGMLCEHGFAGGWPSIFYVGGVMGLLWCICLTIFVFDSPSCHPRITQEEKEFLEKNSQTEDESKKRTSWIELWRVFTAPAIVVYIITQYGSSWGFFSMVVYLPLYLREVLDFNVADNGLLSATPYLLSLATHYLCGPLSDWLATKKFCSLTVQRKVFTAIGTLIPGLLMFLMGLFDCDNRELALLVLTLSVMMTEFCIVGGYQFSLFDVAPDYAGVITGVSHTLATSSGFFSPIVMALLTPNGTQEEWLVVFYVTGTIYLVCCVTYSLFGTSKPLVIKKRRNSLVDPSIIEPLNSNKK
ncbi:uncharacterized transporter slc-17.2-like isoform X2 [Artemia franciscana]